MIDIDFERLRSLGLTPALAQRGRFTALLADDRSA